MKIKMTIGLAGQDFSLAPNEETTRFSDKEAKRLVEAGYAVPVAGDPTREKAVKKPVPEKRG